MTTRSSFAKRAGLGLSILFWVLALPQPQVVAKPSFVVRPEPAWVRQFEINRDAGPRDRPTSILLEDRETKLSANTVERFYRHSERVNTNAGLERLSQLQFNFEPSYESLAVHFIRIIRDGQTRNALTPSAIKIIAKEDDLDEQIYNGTLTAVVFVNDVRVGDVVEYAYTVSGSNPVFGGRFADKFYLADEEPILNLRVRLVSPLGRTLYFRNQGTDLAAKQNSSASDNEYVWDRSDVPAIDPEDLTPSWFEPTPSVTVSEFGDWQALAQWAAPMYQASQTLPPELKKKAEGWLKEIPAPEDRMIAALRFVQQEIRYLGIELGPYSHSPSPPAQTFSRRFGDCKDKSLLLTSILNFLQIDSAVALVNTSAVHTLDDQEPSPDAFDHAIVQAKIGSRTFWLDPTIESQRGNVAAYYDPPYERALVLRPDSRALETIPPAKLESPATEVKETYRLRPGSEAASLQVTTTCRGADADDLRYSWSQRSAEETGKIYLNYYAENNPSIKADGPPTINDNEKDNVITVEENYVIDSFWKNESHYFSGATTYDELPRPKISQRLMPLELHPAFVRQTIEIESVSPSDLTPHSEVIDNDSFRFEYKYQPAAASIRLSYSLQTFGDNVAPQKVAAYLAQADRVWNSTGVQLPRQQGVVFVRRAEPTARESGVAIVAAILLAGCLITVGAFVIVRIRRDKRTPFLPKPLPGTSPQTAMRCKDRSDLEAFTRGFKCRCGTSAFDPEAFTHQETLFYDGERLGTFKVRCQSCGHTSDIYFVQPPALANA
ncbi:MAG TPA: DUF3857 domain-containing protein [Pyrinomonadaceae bacterium]|nr:DUF3857 domain-containing protein [Pyrinomonadaceae bacterium]